MNTQVQQLNGKCKLIIALLLLNVLSVSAQISGNQVYGKNNYNGNNYNQETLPNNSKVSINDNVLNYKENNFLAAVHFGKAAGRIDFFAGITGFAVDLADIGRASLGTEGAAGDENGQHAGEHFFHSLWVH